MGPHLVNVGVLKHKQRGLAAKLEREALQTALTTQLRNNEHSINIMHARAGQTD